MERALEYARAHRAQNLNELIEFLRIPSISALPEHKGDVARAGQFLADELTRIGIRHVRVMPTNGHPVVYGEWLDATASAAASAPTVLIYGHYDVQPVDPLDLWQSPPFEPTLRDGKLYARGATDDKGQVWLIVKALEATLATAGRLPVNVKLLIEGEEESSSANLEAFVLANKALLAADQVLICDTGFLAPDRPALPYSVRGIIGAEAHITGPKTDLHSGSYGGTVRNPAHALAAIIAALHDEHGHIRIPGFYDSVRPLSNDERAALKAVPYTLEKWQRETGLETPWGEPDFTLLERTGARPTCEVNGMWSGFQGEGGKTIIPAKAGAKFTMRLVADQDPTVAGQQFKDYVLSLAPKDLKVEVLLTEGCAPAMTPLDAPGIRAAVRVYETIWGVPPVYLRGGGSLPILATFRTALGLPFVCLGFGLPGSGAHAPNEQFDIEQFHRGTEGVIRYLHYLVG
jgi:acetylornithine deacetylase/succinyl-diaminopimelate desuccinylase-like protein